jgi:hypothetical protein
MNRLAQFFIYFFGTFGLGGFGHGLMRYFTSGRANEYLIIALAGLAIFALCYLWKKIIERKLQRAAESLSRIPYVM